MRNHQLETMFTGRDLDLDLRIAFRVGGLGGGLPAQRGGSAFDGTGHSPSGPSTSGTDKPRGKKGEGAVIHRGTGEVPGLVAKRKNEAEAQAKHGVAMMGTKPRGGLRAV